MSNPPPSFSYARVGVSTEDALASKVPCTYSPSSSRRRVCVIGAGAAGMSAAWALSRHPDRFDVEVWEAAAVAGGVATSIALKIDKDGSALAYDPTDPEASPHMPRPGTQAEPSRTEKQTAPEWTWINDGVQGMSPQFHNTRNFFRALGFAPTPLAMKFSFNKGVERHWDNSSDGPLLERMRSNTMRFGILLKIMHYLAPLFTFIPISLLIKLVGFSHHFHELIIIPLTALFMGTGNRTSSVSASIVGQSFTNPLASLFQYDSKRVVANQPEMAAFPCLHSVYQSAKVQVESSSDHATVHLNRPVKRVFRYDDHVIIVDTSGRAVRFDDVILACSPEVSLRILHHPSIVERIALGNVAFYDDVTVTHQDEPYMRQLYDVDHKRADQYYIYSYEDDPEHIEMSFNLSNYQSQLQQLKPSTSSSKPVSVSHASGPSLLDVWQSIYLNQSLASRRWTIDRLESKRIVATKWWRQMAHRWQHFSLTVPLVHQLHSRRRHTLYAGSWMLVNMHEVAVLSGLSAAYELGADYPFPEDKKAIGSFYAFLLIAHGTVPRQWRSTARTIIYSLLTIILAIILYQSM